MRQVIRIAAAAVSASLATGLLLDSRTSAQDRNADAAGESETGLIVNKPDAYQGYSLVAPMNAKSTYLIDMEGRIVNEWKSEYTPALSAYLLPNGHLLRPGADRGWGGPDRRSDRNPRGQGRRDRAPTSGSDRPDGAPGFGGPGGGFPGGGPGGGGRVQEFDWNGEIVWDLSFREAFPDSKLTPHHDICPLPNGNVLVVCSDPKTKEESLAAGRLPPIAPDQLLADAIVEIKPVGRTGGEIVWAWHAWDHLVQEVHRDKPNFGEVSDHPHRIDVNFVTGMMDHILQDPEQLAKLRSLGYVGGAAQPPAAPRGGGDRRGRADRRDRNNGRRGGPGGGGDWMHVNSVAYNPQLDQIMISVHEFSEVWVIDHSTTTAEAASGSGGRYGKGGDLLYRWGNPKVYRNGTNADQRLFAQHCAHWIAEGLPGAGNMLVFNNGMNRPDGSYSTVDEIELPINGDGSYAKEEFIAFEPFQATWSYGSKDNPTFFSMLISGAQRLPNGNTFICSGTQGLLFEVTPAGEIVWQYKHPGSGFGGPGGSRMDGLVPDFLADMLGIDEAQRAQLKTLQDEVTATLQSLLTEEQRATLNSSGAFPGAGPGGFVRPKFGEVISETKRDELELTRDQARKVGLLQRDVTKRLNGILTVQQREGVAEMERRFADGGPGRFGPPDGDRPPGDDGSRGGDGPRGGFGPPGGNGPPGGFGPPDGDGPPRGFGPPGGFAGRGGPDGRGPGGIFRSYRYGPDFPGLQDKDLTPGEQLADVVASEAAESPSSPGRPPFDGAPQRNRRRN